MTETQSLQLSGPTAKDTHSSVHAEYGCVVVLDEDGCWVVLYDCAVPAKICRQGRVQGWGAEECALGVAEFHDGG